MYSFTAASVVALAAWSAANPMSIEKRDYTAVCSQIGTKISSASQMVYPINLLQYEQDIEHWYLTSTQQPACVVEVGNAQDASAVMKIVGASRTPFAIRSGGHSSNPGFSSTTGVHIALNRLTGVKFSSDNSTVELGLGSHWSDIYKTLQPTGYMVTGGRTQGPGLGGFTLGGGYSWKTNQFGLTSDTVKSYTLVLPNGTISTIDSSKPDLFWALKGGLNRFGLVTSAVYYTHKQPPQVYGGINLYDSSNLAAVLNATHAFDTYNTDPRAQIITTLEGSSTGVSALVLFFYDGATKPSSFSYFDGITPTFSTIKQQTFSDFVGGIVSSLITNARGTFNTLSTTRLTPGFLKAVANESAYWGQQSLLHSGSSISYDVEPFRDYGTHAVDSAFPHADSPLPLNLYFAWSDASQDQYWTAAMIKSVATLKQVAISEGIYKDDFTVYPNYAISGTPSSVLYGSPNAARLRAIRKAVDPNNVMGLAGGFDV